MKTMASLLLLAALGCSGCITIKTAPPVTQPGPGPAQPADPEPNEPDVTYMESQSFQFLTNGRAVFLIENVSSIPIGSPDNWVLFNLTGECSGYDFKAPIAEVAIRGKLGEDCSNPVKGCQPVRPKPCLAKPCRENIGVTVRYTSNLEFDHSLDWSPKGEPESIKVSCGAGMNYHHRLATGPMQSDSVIIVMQWDSNWLTTSVYNASDASPSGDLATGAQPIDVARQPLRRTNSLGFCRVVWKTPWLQKDKPRRGWYWDTFSAWRKGMRGRVLQWQATGTQHPLGACP